MSAAIRPLPPPKRRGRTPVAVSPVRAPELRPIARETVTLGRRGEAQTRQEVARYQDAHLADRMARVGQLTDRQHAAALVILALYARSGIEPQTTATYAPPGWTHPTSDAEEPAALTAYRRLLRTVPGPRATLLDSLCLGVHPGIRGLALLQDTLDDFAALWRLDGGGSAP